MSQGIHFFSEISTAPLFFLLSTPHFSKIPVFPRGPVLLQFYPSVHDRMKMRNWSDKKAPSYQKKKNYQESGIRSKPSSVCIIAGINKMKVEINIGVNCSITLLVVSEIKARNSTLINLYL